MISSWKWAGIQRQEKKYWELYVGADLRRMFITIYRECADVMTMRR